MKSIFRNIAALVAVAALLSALSSCQKQTCPTYTKVETEQTNTNV